MSNKTKGKRSGEAERGVGSVSLLALSCLRRVLRHFNTDPTPARLRPTVASLPNCSLLAIAYMGGECLRSPFAKSAAAQESK